MRHGRRGPSNRGPSAFGGRRSGFRGQRSGDQSGGFRRLLRRGIERFHAAIKNRSSGRTSDRRSSTRRSSGKRPTSRRSSSRGHKRGSDQHNSGGHRGDHRQMMSKMFRGAVGIDGEALPEMFGPGRDGRRGPPPEIESLIRKFHNHAGKSQSSKRSPRRARSTWRQRLKRRQADAAENKAADEEKTASKKIS